MRLGIWPKPEHSWSEVLRIATHAERRGWEGVWFADHFMPARGDLSEPMLECWATLSGLAATVPRLRIGALVSSATYRHPAVLANTATTTDHISGGRVVLGMGAGWQENEHAAYGLDLGPVAPRLDRLEEACRVIVGLRDTARFSFAGHHYRLEDAPMEPKPLGPLPLLVGGGGERRTIPIAARYADEWNVWGSPETFAHKSDVLDRACEERSRDPKEIRRSTQALLAVDAPDVLPLRAPQTRRPVVVATPAQLTETLGRYAQAGVDELIVPDFHLEGADETIAVIDVLSEDVLPSLP